MSQQRSFAIVKRLKVLLGGIITKLLRLAKRMAILAAIFMLYVLVAQWWFALPKLPTPPSQVEAELSHVLTENSLLKQKFIEANAAYPGLSGFKVLNQGIDAFTSRMFLIENATHSIAAQYYIWQDDLTGLLMLNAIKQAADRGVQVRLLLDDNGIDGLDQIIAELNQHPLIEIRLYNPFVVRYFKLLNFTFDFFRLNRRMHNNALIVDEVVAITGGRNIGDAYFDFGENFQFVDLDVLTVGAVMPSLRNNFNLFFNSEVSYPVESIIETEPAEPDAEALDQALIAFNNTAELSSYLQALAGSDFLDELNQGQFIDEWTTITMISDDPRKTLGIHYENELMVTRLGQILQSPQHKLDVVTPYFVPGDAVVMFTDLQQSGVDVRILTNAFEATDVMPVHSGYAKYRHQLLTAGVPLLELKSRSSIREKELGIMGSSASSLHAKVFAVDSNLAFIGSFNFDPRSTMLNTEMGLLIESETMAKKIHQHFDQRLLLDAYKLELNESKQIIWLERIADESGIITTQTYINDPSSTWLERMVMSILGVLPIESLL